MATAQEQTQSDEHAFNFETKVRLHAILPIGIGNHYLAEANDSNLSAGFNMSFFEYHHFRLLFGVDHIFYEPTDINITADINRSRYTSFNFNVSYEIPVVEKFSVQPYIGFGSSELYFRRTASTVNASDVSIRKQRGKEFRVGIYLDYKLNDIVTVFTGGNYVGSKMKINTASELESYFGKAETAQVYLGLKLGYSMKDKRKAKAEKQVSQDAN
jgi:outer membrane protein W